MGKSLLTREVLLSKIEQFCTRCEAVDTSAVAKFTSMLSDGDLRALVKMLGRMAHRYDQKRAEAIDSLSLLIGRLSMEDSHEVVMVIIRAYADETPDYYLSSLWMILKRSLECENRELDVIRAQAHLEMMRRYEPIDINDYLHYGRSQLHDFVNKHPEDVELILRLRDERKIRDADMTDELLLEFKASHMSLSSGLL